VHAKSAPVDPPIDHKGRSQHLPSILMSFSFKLGATEFEPPFASLTDLVAGLADDSNFMAR
jgi:hypothetical protein